MEVFSEEMDIDTQVLMGMRRREIW